MALAAVPTTFHGTPARAATIQGIVSALDSSNVHNIAEGNHNIEVSVGPPNSDSWCSVEVRAPENDNVEYVWLKDAASPTARRVYGAKYVKPSQAPVLTQQLKVGYRAVPFYYSRATGVFEGEAFTVGR